MNTEDEIAELRKRISQLESDSEPLRMLQKYWKALSLPALLALAGLFWVGTKLVTVPTVLADAGVQDSVKAIKDGVIDAKKGNKEISNQVDKATQFVSKMQNGEIKVKTLEAKKLIVRQDGSTVLGTWECDPGTGRMTISMHDANESDSLELRVGRAGDRSASEFVMQNTRKGTMINMFTRADAAEISIKDQQQATVTPKAIVDSVDAQSKVIAEILNITSAVHTALNSKKDSDVVILAKHIQGVEDDWKIAKDKIKRELHDKVAIPPSK